MEYIFKNIGVFISSDPSQGMQLVGAARNVGKESGELISTNVQGDANVAQLLLQHCGDQPRVFISRRFQGYMEAYAIHSRISCLLQQLPRPIRIVVVVWNITVVRPAFRRQKAISRAPEVS